MSRVLAETLVRLPLEIEPCMAVWMKGKARRPPPQAIRMRPSFMGVWPGLSTCCLSLKIPATPRPAPATQHTIEIRLLKPDEATAMLDDMSLKVIAAPAA